MRTINKIKYIGIEVLLIVATIVAAVMYAPHWSKGCYDLEEAIDNNQEIGFNDYVKIAIDAPVDTYAETTITKDGKQTDSNTSYMILTQNNKIISLTAKGSDNLGTLNKLSDDFWSYMDGNTDKLPEKVEFTGIVRKLSDDAKKYYDQGIHEYGIDENQNIEILYIDVNTMQSSKDQKLVVGVLAGISVIYGAFAAFMVVKKRV